MMSFEDGEEARLPYFVLIAARIFVPVLISVGLLETRCLF